MCALNAKLAMCACRLFCARTSPSKPASSESITFDLLRPGEPIPVFSLLVKVSPIIIRRTAPRYLSCPFEAAANFGKTRAARSGWHIIKPDTCSRCRSAWSSRPVRDTQHNARKLHPTPPRRPINDPTEHENSQFQGFFSRLLSFSHV